MFSHPLKRPRECDFDSELCAHDHHKKLRQSWQAVPDATPCSATDLDQTLRFRAAALTPIDSSDDEADHEDGGNLGASTSPNKPAQARRPPALQLSPSSAAAQLSLLADGDHLSPWPVGAHSGSSTHPSPIPHNMVNHSLSLSGAQSTASTPGYFTTAIPVMNQPEQDHNMMEEERPSTPTARLPSPVSDEDAAMASDDKPPPEDTEMDYFQPSAAPALKPDPPPAKPAEQYSQQTHEDLMKQAAASTPTQRKRPALVMGFRADCEKCRCRVPGHYNHILRN